MSTGRLRPYLVLTSLTRHLYNILFKHVKYLIILLRTQHHIDFQLRPIPDSIFQVRPLILM